MEFLKSTKTFKERTRNDLLKDHKRKDTCLLVGSCISGNVYIWFHEKSGGHKWPCCTLFSSSMGSALFLGEYANIILMRCEALHLTFVGLLSSGACVPAVFVQ
ncbi:hypothetical protein GQ457_02G027840 [Hibiscus cannabinus]